MDWLTPKLKQKLKDIFKRDYNKEYNDTEIEEVARNLVGYFEVLIKMKQRQDIDKNKGKTDHKEITSKEVTK